MIDSSKDFKIIIPAELSKSEDGEWIVQGLASTSSRDQQGEIILPEGIDASPIDQGRGVLNWDHQKGPENTLGLLDSYAKTPAGFFVKGRLFKNHSKAKSVQEIMSSLGKSDKGRMGLSVEGKILQREGPGGRIIKKCQINAVALTMNPVNQDSYVDLVKSMTSEDVDFQATEESAQLATSPQIPAQTSFTPEQVLQLIQKALSVGSAAATEKPAARSGGDALAQESLDPKEKDLSVPAVKRKLKKGSKELFKSYMTEILDKVCELYPNNSKEQVWAAVKDRLSKKFPELAENDK